ncbi:hypothetical protein C8E08_3740 [Paracidovorax citrulli]|uniref:Uncharacterized protein n=2 Tax=Paracidovorax citrulli TaxID=80869 RepID=A1TMF9_PARC0|nr:hypothetical protein Aave_1558 [Paracidovorax citrulli AAC00-1]PVY66336.1 hypothetical protein C8E08_3740 [Paracidovorax citrulli]REG69492.1 hypothetical protein C8E07_2647 [Paracidovorax citrulli]RLJ94046.1 hypothetical protein C8E06_2646 [Paracidovorax citrulli]
MPGEVPQAGAFTALDYARRGFDALVGVVGGSHGRAQSRSPDAEVSCFQPCSEMHKIFLPFVLWVGLNAAAEEGLDASKLDAHQFTLGHAGFAGHISEPERYMEMVAKNPNAVKFFSGVIDDASSTSVAKLYALCGMKKAGARDLQSYEEKVLKVGGKVSTMHGDQMQKEEIGFFVHRIRTGGCNQ